MILDSVSVAQAFGGELMPFVASLRPRTTYGQARACVHKSTFACIKTLFEGRAAAMGTTLQNFSAEASVQPNWPTSLARMGLQIAVASDHVLNRLYPAAWSRRFDYESFPADVLAQDARMFALARQWLDDPGLDVLVLHEIGTDKVAHEYSVGGPEYRAKYREVDAFVEHVASRLGPDDYLFLLGDHGHNETGGHTTDAAYLARGPLFAPGLRHDLEASDVLLLLSAPYELALPPNYEGRIHTGFLRWPEAARRRWLGQQARALQLTQANLRDVDVEALERAVDGAFAARRARSGERSAREIAWTLAPWLVTGALLLMSLLVRPVRSARHGCELFLRP
jgi:hypothetical protein